MPGRRELNSDDSFAALFGTELARLRTSANMSQSDLGQLINYSAGHVSMVEIAKRPPSKGFAESCDDALKTGGLLARLWPFVNRDLFPAWFQGYVQLEAEATKIQTYECQTIPGLLQTAGYARAVLEAGWIHDIEQRVTARMERQEILQDSSRPLMWVLLDEAVLRRPVGGVETMHEQLKRLADLAAARRIVLQVIPDSAGAHACMDGAMTLLSFSEGSDVAYVEGPGTGQLIDRPDEVAQCQHRYDLSRAVALSPEASVRTTVAAMEEA